MGKPEKKKTYSTFSSAEDEISLLREEVQALEKQNEELIKHNDYLEQKLGIDHLTGAANRKTFDQEIGTSLLFFHGEREEHRGHKVFLGEASLIAIDLDFFKKVNDAFGHPAGDEVLQKVSVLLMDSVRDSDTVARFGGEEFMIFLPGMLVQTAARHAERLRSSIEQLSFEEYPNLKITASFGVVSSRHSRDPKELYSLADKALYEAKRGGRNRVMILNGD